MVSTIELDLRGVISPLNLLKCKSRLTSMKTGDILEVLLVDMDVVTDLIMIVKRSDDEIAFQKKRADCICLGIRKGP